MTLVRDQRWGQVSAGDLPGLWRLLDEVLGDVRRVLNRGVKLRDQFTGVRSFEWIEGGAAVPVSVPFARPPLGVLVLDVRDDLDPDVRVTGPTLSWAWSPSRDAGQVVVSAISGLTSGRRYLVTVLVMEEG